MKHIGRGAARLANVADEAVGIAGSSAARVVNAAENITDTARNTVMNVTEEVAEGFTDVRKTAKHSYQNTRNKSPRVQREIEEGVRNIDGTRKPKVKEATRAADEAPSTAPVSESGDDVVSQAIKYKKEAQDATKFTYQGRQYIKMDDGSFYSKGMGKRDQWASISGKEYKKAHADNVIAQENLGRQMDIDQAFGVTTTESSAWDGIAQFAKDNAAVTAAGIATAGIGGALIVSSLLDDDE